MSKYVEKIWKELAKKYDIIKTKGIRFENNGFLSVIDYFWDRSFDDRLRSSPYRSFKFNINRVMHLFEEIINVNPIIEVQQQKWINLRYQLLSETIIILLITSFEVYLTDKFRRISEQITIKELKSEKLLRFLKKINLRDEIIKKILAEGDCGFFLSEIIPDKISLQNKDTLKISYDLIEINLPSIDSELWEKIFAKTDDGYMTIRHRFIHEGSKEFLEKKRYFNISFLEETIFNIVEFVFETECQIFSIYPKEFDE